MSQFRILFEAAKQKRAKFAKATGGKKLPAKQTGKSAPKVKGGISVKGKGGALIDKTNAKVKKMKESFKEVKGVKKPIEQSKVKSHKNKAIEDGSTTPPNKSKKVITENLNNNMSTFEKTFVSLKEEFAQELDAQEDLNNAFDADSSPDIQEEITITLKPEQVQLLRDIFAQLPDENLEDDAAELEDDAAELEDDAAELEDDAALDEDEEESDEVVDEDDETVDGKQVVKPCDKPIKVPEFLKGKVKIESQQGAKVPPPQKKC